MSSFLKPKSNIWKSKQDLELPLYYKDKLQQDTNVVQSILRTPRKKKMLIKAFLASLALYVILWFYSVLPEKKVDVWNERKLKVKDVFLESWHDYAKHGWGYDVYRPISQTSKNMGNQPLGWIIVDSLDTLMLMDCQDELEEAKSWVKYELNYDFDYQVNTFETTIRMLGGLLSAHYLSEEDVYLEKATDLANTLVGAFSSKSGLPYASVNLKSGKGIKSHVDRGASSTAEAATLQLELKYLSKLTGETLYWEKAEKVMQVLDANQPEGGLVPIFVNPETGKYQGKLIRLGSRGDSYYEYLLKQYLQTGETIYLQMYLESFHGIKEYLLSKSHPHGLTFLGERENGLNGPLSSKMDHLVCFIGGLFAMGATEGQTYEEARNSKSWNEEKQAQFDLGEEMTYTCYTMYHNIPTGLSPEIVVFNTDPNNRKDFTIKLNDRHNLQRPETVESLFYLYKITGDVKYREWGWEIFENFVKYTKVTSGGKDNKPRYTSLQDVTLIPPKNRDNMESFWLAETLKYLYLLFDDSDDPKWDIKNVVFNTEAHPFPKFDMGDLFTTGWERGKPIVPQNEPKIVEKTEYVTPDKTKAKAPAADEKQLEVPEIPTNEKPSSDQDESKQPEIPKAALRDDSIELDEAYQEVPKIPVHEAEPVVHEVKDNLESVNEEGEAKQAAVKTSKLVAEKLKQKGKIPAAKQPVAKPLNEQVDQVIEESDDAAIAAEDVDENIPSRKVIEKAAAVN